MTTLTGGKTPGELKKKKTTIIINTYNILILYYYLRGVDGCSARESIYGSERARLITREPWNGGRETYENYKLLYCSLRSWYLPTKKKVYSYKIEQVCVVGTHSEGGNAVINKEEKNRKPCIP